LKYCNKINYIFKPLGDSALIVQLDDAISEATHTKVINLVKLLETKPFPGLIEVIPGYNNVTIHYDPINVYGLMQTSNLATAFEIVSDYIKFSLTNVTKDCSKDKNIIEIPVLYGDEYGPDLEYVAKYNKTTPETVIEFHSKKDYLVYMIGFTPGFPYLGGVDKRISTPRKAQPRLQIKAGSVGIAGEQTGIYSIDSPGGWQIIGKSPVKLFAAEKEHPTLLQSGDIIRFTPISKAEYLSIKEQS